MNMVTGIEPAGRLSDGRLNPDVLSSLPDEELMAELTAIPGICGDGGKSAARY